MRRGLEEIEARQQEDPTARQWLGTVVVFLLGAVMLLGTGSLILGLAALVLALVAGVAAGEAVHQWEQGNVK